MNFKNQLSIFNPDDFKNLSVSVIGCGAIGSFTSLILAKMGLKNFILYDSDTIEEYNIPNQFYMLDQIGVKKIDALNQVLVKFAEVETDTNNNLTEEDELFSEIVIACTDNMHSRKLAYNKAKSLSSWFIDARMSGQTYRIYTIDLTDENKRLEYEKTLYSDDVSDVGKCTEKTIIYNVSEIAAKICSQVRKVLTKQTYYDMLAYDFVNDILIKKSFNTQTHSEVEK
jgi:molybdopterin/thiamine biosynthesis adenylyltransferase